MRNRLLPARAIPIAAILVALAVATPAVARTVVVEKTANLDIARRVAALLRAEGVEVRMTRTSDVTLDPSDRTGPANRAKVDAFISIHNNAAAPSASGTQVFRSLRGTRSERLGARIRSAFRDTFGDRRRADLLTRRGCCGDYYFQLRETTMPAVIVEAAFVTNPTEGPRLAGDPAFRERLARAIADGILSYQRSLRPSRPPSPDRGTVVPAPLLPPVDATARALGATRVKITWTGVQSVRTYRIYRDGRLLATRTGEPGSRLTFTDRWAAPGQTYTYEVHSTDGVAGVYAESAAVPFDATTPAITVMIDPGHGGRDPGAIGRF